MGRRTFEEVAARAIAAERAGVARHAERYCADVTGLERKRRIPAGEADMLRRRIRAFAADIEAGLHVKEGAGHG